MPASWEHLPKPAGVVLWQVCVDSMFVQAMHVHKYHQQGNYKSLNFWSGNIIAVRFLLFVFIDGKNGSKEWLSDSPKRQNMKWKVFYKIVCWGPLQLKYIRDVTALFCLSSVLYNWSYYRMFSKSVSSYDVLEISTLFVFCSSSFELALGGKCFWSAFTCRWMGFT